MAKQVVVDLVLTDKQITSVNRVQAQHLIQMINQASSMVRDSFDTATYKTRITSTTNGRGAQLIWGAYKELFK